MKLPKVRVLKLDLDQQVTYRTWGSAKKGKPLIYSHGFPSSHLEAIFLAEEAIKQGFFLISYDRPGYGGTSRSLGGKSTFHQIPMLLADHFSFERFNIIGISGGAPTAIVTAIKEPKRVKSLTVVCGLAPYAAEFHGDFPKRFKVGFKLMKTLPSFAVEKILSSKGFRVGKNLKKDLLKILLPPKDFAVVTSNNFEEFLKHSRKISSEQISAGVITDLKIFSTDWWGQKKIEVPSVFWHGEKDPILPSKMSQRWKKLQPQLILKLLPDEGHYSLPLGYAKKILNSIDR